MCQKLSMYRNIIETLNKDQFYLRSKDHMAASAINRHDSSLEKKQCYKEKYIWIVDSKSQSPS